MGFKTAYPAGLFIASGRRRPDQDSPFPGRPEGGGPALRGLLGDGGLPGLALKQTSREATVLLYAPALDPHLQEMSELADRVFYMSWLGRKAREKLRRG